MKMQKKSSRALRRAMALGMSLALVVSSIVVSPTADAAKKKKPTLSAKKKTLTYNNSKKKSFTLKIKKNKVKKIKKTTWKTSKKSVVSISKKKKTSVKVTAKKKGSAKITATVKYTVKGSKKVKKVKLTCKVTSKKGSSKKDDDTSKKTNAPAATTPAGGGSQATAAPTKAGGQMTASPAPTDPAASNKPTDPAASNKPTDPAASNKPTDPAASNKPTDPAASNKPTDPAASNKPTDPVASSKPTVPNASSKPDDPTTSDKPDGPGTSGAPTTSDKPDGPGTSGAPTTSDKPDGPGTSGAPTTSDKPDGPGTSGAPTTSDKPDGPGTSGAPTTSDKPDGPGTSDDPTTSDKPSGSPEPTEAPLVPSGSATLVIDEQPLLETVGDCKTATLSVSGTATKLTAPTAKVVSGKAVAVSGAATIVGNKIRVDVKAVAAGSADIEVSVTATVDGKEGLLKKTLSYKDIAATTIKPTITGIATTGSAVSGSSIVGSAVNLGKALNVTLPGLPDDANVAWASDNESVAPVTGTKGTAKITGENMGFATVTATVTTANGTWGTAEIPVTVVTAEWQELDLTSAANYDATQEAVVSKSGEGSMRIDLPDEIVKRYKKGSEYRVKITGTYDGNALVRAYITEGVDDATQFPAKFTEKGTNNEIEWEYIASNGIDATGAQYGLLFKGDQGQPMPTGLTIKSISFQEIPRQIDEDGYEILDLSRLDTDSKKLYDAKTGTITSDGKTKFVDIELPSIYYAAYRDGKKIAVDIEGSYASDMTPGTKYRCAIAAGNDDPNWGDVPNTIETFTAIPNQNMSSMKRDYTAKREASWDNPYAQRKGYKAAPMYVALTGTYGVESGNLPKGITITKIRVKTVEA